jgi:hypothetical protein
MKGKICYRGGFLKKRLAITVALAVMTLCFPVWIGGQQARAADINILPYYAAGNVGDYWTYSFISPQDTPGFTTHLTQVTLGLLSGKYRLGDYVDIVDPPYEQYFIFDLDAGGINVYETEMMGPLAEPVTMKAVQKLGEVVPSPFPGDTSSWYFQKIPSLTVLAGTFYDVLVHINLGSFGRTTANTAFGLDHLSLGVTHVEWLATGIGKIQDRDYDKYGNILFEYQLKATSVTKKSSNPAIRLLLLEGGYVQ